MDEKILCREIDELNFAVERSMRYHSRRRGFYDSFHKMIMFFIILLGSAAFAHIPLYLFDSNFYVLGAIVSILAAIDLVWGMSHRARDHELLFRRFSNLAIRIRTEKSSEDVYKEWVKERITIEMDEPPIYCALEADCDNEVRRAWGRDKELVKIGLWYRATMYVARWSQKNFEPVPKSTL